MKAIKARSSSRGQSTRVTPIHKPKRLFVSAAIVAFFMLTRLDSLAVGFRLPNQDPEGIARGNAFVATADNPAAVYYNPAGIVQLEGHNAQVGLYLLDVNVEYSANGGPSIDNDSELTAVPQVYYAWSPEGNFALGLGVYAPYGLSLKWPDSSPFRTLAKEGELLYLTINPVVAWQIHPRLSIAAGPTFNVSEADFRQGVSSDVDLFKVKGDGFAVGFNAGLFWQAHERVAFGVQYRFPTTVDYSGSASYTMAPGMTPFSSGDATAEIQFPQYVVAGVCYRPTPHWNLEFDLDWTDWDNVNDVPIRNTPLGDVSLVFNWCSSFMYEFGVTRELGKGFFASGGYFFSENSIPDKTFSPLVPDADLHLGSVGFGHRGSRWSWTVAYHFALGNRTVSGGDPRASGDYDIFNQAWTASLRFTF